MIAPLRASRVLPGLAVLVVVMWLVAPGPGLPERRAPAPEPWQVPPVIRVAPEKSLETLAKANLWGKLPDAATLGPPTDPRWRLLGIVASGAERYVLIGFEGLPEQKLAVNDMLPGGSRILRIDEDSLCILVNGARRKLGIYKTGPQIL